MEMDKEGEPQQKPLEPGERIEITASYGFDGLELGVIAAGLVAVFVFPIVLQVSMPHELLMIRNFLLVGFLGIAFRYMAELNADDREAKERGISPDNFRSAKEVAIKLHWEKYFEKRKAWANDREARINSLAQKMDLK